MKKLLAPLIMIAALLVFGSCSPSQHVVTEQPVPPVYIRPATPGTSYIWTEGDWIWRNGKYVYTNGSWVKPKADRKWVDGEWIKVDKGYYWRKGYWQ